MTLKTPAFWTREQSLAATLLSPLSYLYQWGQSLHNDSAPYKSSLPVICVGNLTAGGGGKTPTVQALIKLIKQHSLAQAPCILSRGYGGKKDLHLVDPKADRYDDVGDEPLLLSKDAPVVIAKNRAAGAKLIEKLSKQRGFDLIIMDDGFQNPSLHKDCSILVADGQTGFGNRRLLPAGPLREPISEGSRRADCAVIIGKDTYGLTNYIPSDLPLFSANITADLPEHTAAPYIAFCGLAQPEKFKSTLAAYNVPYSDFRTFPDHHPYNDKDVDKLLSSGQRLITTEKDASRLRSFPQITEHLDILPICLNFEDEGTLIKLIRGCLAP